MSKPEDYKTNLLILSLIKQKKEEGMQRLSDIYFRDLFRYAFRLTGSKEDSEDILQTVFMDLWQNSSKRDIKELKHYLFRMVKFQVYDLWAKKTDISELLEEYNQILAGTSPSPSDIIESCELQTEIEKAVNTLPIACRQVYDLSRNEGLSHDEIANKLNLSKQTVKNQLTKALSTIRNQAHVRYLLISAKLIVLFLMQV